MSVAALEVLVLHHALASADRGNLAVRFSERAEKVVDIAWLMAVGADFGFPETTGPKPRGTDLFGRYPSRLTRKAHTDGELREALFRVIMMKVPPTTLLRPGVAWKVLRPTRTGTRPDHHSSAEGLSRNTPYRFVTPGRRTTGDVRIDNRSNETRGMRPASRTV